MYMVWTIIPVKGFVILFNLSCDSHFCFKQAVRWLLGIPRERKRFEDANSCIFRRVKLFHVDSRKNICRRNLHNNFGQRFHYETVLLIFLVLDSKKMQWLILIRPVVQSQELCRHREYWSHYLLVNASQKWSNLNNVKYVLYNGESDKALYWRS